MTESYGQKLARDMIDGVVRQAGNINLKSDNDESAIDPETKKKLIEREIKMASDPDYELEELAKEKAAKRMRDILSGRGGTTMEEQQKTIEEERKRKADEELNEKAMRIEQAKALYNSCIEAGSDPKRCAEMVAGLMPTPATMGAPPATSITELVTALKALDDLRGSDKGLAELKQGFDSLAAEIRKGNTSQQPLDPVAFAKQQAEVVAAWHKVLQELTPSAVAASTGDPLDVVQERNRHDEAMEGLKTEKEYKEKLGDTLADLPERVGRGLGGQIMEGEGSKGGGSGGRGGGGGGLDIIDCECGRKIRVAPGADSVTCECGIIYNKTGTVETRQE